MGFRRLAKKLASQGFKVNKDKANRLYKKYKVSIDAEIKDNNDLTHLRLAEARQRQIFEVQKEKEEIRNRLEVLFVEKSTMTFEQRKRLFSDQNRMYRFAKRVMRTFDPMLWSEVVTFCEERGYDLTDAIAIVAGEQLDYETQPTFNSGAKKRSDLYLQEAIRTCLADWKKEEQEENDNSQDSEPEPLRIRETEIVRIELPDEFYSS